MKKSILFITFSLLISTLSLSQWEKIAQIENDNLYQLIKLNSETTIATGEKTSIYDLNSTTPSEISNVFYTYGFLTSALVLDDNLSYLGGGCYYTFDECPANTLYKSENSGQTWIEISTESTFTETGNTVGILPINDNELVLVSEYYKLKRVNISTGISTTVVIPGTEDANNFTMGKTSQSGKWLVAASFYDVAFQNTVKYYESDNKGMTWSEVGVDFDESERIAFIDYLPNNNLAAITNRGNSYHIMDGNKNYIGNISDAHVQISAQYIINNKDWYVASFDQETNESKLHLSQDGGQSWNTEAIFNEGRIGNLSFTDRNNGFFIFNSRGVYQKTGPNITQNQEYSTFTISPNPVKDVLNINLDINLQEYSIDIIDAVGRKTRHIKSAESQYDISELASGYYQILLLDASGKIIAREPFVKG
ncbi:MAG: photosystem II stability/assembly factor-like uncharacterized protein [Saprospiraceae bacterium]|jgi:photosystem II stability/assembly factor-like uncharacterized protein